MNAYKPKSLNQAEPTADVCNSEMRPNRLRQHLFKNLFYSNLLISNIKFKKNSDKLYGMANTNKNTNSARAIKIILKPNLITFNLINELQNSYKLSKAHTHNFSFSCNKSEQREGLRNRGQSGLER